MSDVQVNFSGNGGHVIYDDCGVMTFEVQGMSEKEFIDRSEYRNTYSRYISDRMTLQLSGYTVPCWGEGHNVYPLEVYSTVSEDKILPEIIRKQVKFLFGNGPILCREIADGDGLRKKMVRVPVTDEKIKAWLESWEDKGYDHHWDYLKYLITDFYYVNTCVSQYNFNLGRRLRNLPDIRHDKAVIDALTYVGADEARLAVAGAKQNQRIKISDCRFVIKGDWMNISSGDYEVFHRLDLRDPLKYPTAISFNADKNFTKWTYAYNEWFKGIREYLTATRLAPKYLNSYLKNALNAHIHVIIPGSWYNQQKQTLQNICQQNKQRNPNTPLQPKYKGVRLVEDKGEPIAFYETMMEELIRNELRSITKMMSGEGKNQGKLYATTRWAKEDGWEFKEFPGKFKEFFDTVQKYSEFADKVITASKGISSSLTNVEGSSIISKSGSDVWYNYLLYGNSLTLDEFFVLKDLNRALYLNFPYAKEQGYKFVFWTEVPERQQDTTASQRPDEIMNK